jgi:hypothetical protein
VLDLVEARRQREPEAALQLDDELSITTIGRWRDQEAGQFRDVSLGVASDLDEPACRLDRASRPPAGTSLDSLRLNARQDQYFASSGEAAVDVVVTPAELKPVGTWTLSDRLGRPLGAITQAFPSLFVIHAHRNTQLSGMDTASFPSLNDAMTAIVRHMKGECQLSSGDEKQWG